MNILVVDDSAAMRNMIIRTLRQAGFDGNEVTQAEDGAVALATRARAKPKPTLASKESVARGMKENIEKHTKSRGVGARSRCELARAPTRRGWITK